MSMTAAFEEFSSYFEQEAVVREEIRNRVREVEKTSREITQRLAKIHMCKNANQLADVVIGVEGIFNDKVRDAFRSLASAVPQGQFYRFSPWFSFVIQRFVFYSALTVYLKTERLIEKKEAADWLGIDETGHFFLDLEDYLSGLTTLCNELSRFCMTSVTNGDYARPRKISEFLNVLLDGFRLLNLKNDALRKKFDSLKYDLKKVEEVVYDLSIRGLLNDLNLEESSPQDQKDEKKITEV